jgi:hypothetical protein
VLFKTISNLPIVSKRSRFIVDRRAGKPVRSAKLEAKESIVIATIIEGIAALKRFDANRPNKLPDA